MMDAQEASRITQLLRDQGIAVWLTGGWGIDALLGEQSRPHKDLDVIMRSDDIYRMGEIMQREGYVTRELWSENRPASDSQGRAIDTAFVLFDALERGFDVHGLTFDAAGNGIPDWNEAGDFIFSKDDLAGRGVIGGAAVQCITAQSQIACHAGYELPDYQVKDMERLRELARRI